MRFPKSRLPLSPRDYAHFAKSGSRIRGFDPSRLPFLRGGIPPDMGESSNFLARDSCLREFAKRPPEARSGCDREQPASAPGAGRGGRSSVRRGTGRLAASGGGHVLSHAIKRRMSQVVSYGVDIFLITFMCSKDGNRRCNIYIYIYIYIYIHTYIYILFLPHAVSASATAVHRGSLRGPTSTREVIKRGGSYAGALQKSSIISLCVFAGRGTGVRGRGEQEKGGEEAFSYP